MALDQIEPDSVEIILVQHLLSDTEEFVRLIRGFGFKVNRIIGIEYSSRQDVVERLRSSGLDVVLPTIAATEDTLRQVLHDQLSGSQSKRIILQEVGGYCANILNAGIEPQLQDRFLGVIEETRQGLWRYRDVSNFPVPVIEIADSFLKSLEARYVGEAVARAVEVDLLESGSTLWGARSVVLGFGDVGSNVANGLRARGSFVSCFDTDPLKLIYARMLGFRSPARERLLADADVVVGASGKRSVTDQDLEQLADGVMLASASSKDVEFPIDLIRSTATRRHVVTPYVNEYTMPWGKRIRVSSEGHPINFRGFSLPHFMSDLLFAQIVAAMQMLLSVRPSNQIHSLSKEHQVRIASEWLDVYQH
jgi:adenosylhomocysteinase